MATQARGLNGSRRLTNQIREQLLAVEVAVFLVKCSWSASQRSWESFSSITPNPKAPQRADLHGQITSFSSFNVQQYSYAEWGWWEGQMNISFSRFESPLGVVWARLELLERFGTLFERQPQPLQMLNIFGAHAAYEFLCGNPWSLFPLGIPSSVS